MEPDPETITLEARLDYAIALAESTLTLVQSLAEQLKLYQPLLDRFANASKANGSFKTLTALRKGH